MSPLALTIAQTSAQPTFLNFVPLILIFAIFYFMMIAPMRKRQKALQETIAGLKKGDKVVTTGGLYGEVHALDETTLVLKVADNVRIKIARSAIAGLQGEETS